jgi:hypothetical protein
VAVEAMFATTQCTYVPFGASGSSTTRASAVVPAGTPDHRKGGDMLRPLQLYTAGICAPSPNAALVTLSVAGALVVGSSTPREHAVVPTASNAASTTAIRDTTPMSEPYATACR